ncbi:uncharacterized protein LOC101889001 isoform X1 [Musca domestica]|uniref:Uncharacterized protein LOC101889001 isoform X1 n=1 Tax=Musca domestica TaxID=7370 RepID=A0A9J7CR63_MUSDO|nr:uncharacterized protein LOC101889001 isoform X1 [Musca domestica]
MYNNVILSLAMSILPVLAIGFVAILVIYKIYIKIRSRFSIIVNCWFCNHNTKVPYLEANSWVCPSCEQYNGFDKDGDYNREIYEQLDCSGISEKRFNVSQSSAYPPKPATNGFCDECNEAQRLKVEKLAQFEPKNESHFDEELKVYQAQLEKQYGLCSTCDRHLNKVLREKKKMVLGSKFLDFIIKGAETLKQPHLTKIEHAIQQTRKQKLRTCIIVLTLFNICCLFSSMPSSTLKREQITNILGESVGQPIFLLASHFIAFTKVLATYWDAIKQLNIIMKISLFSKTIFMMLMYSMGLKVNQLNFSTLFVGAYPFALLGLCFVHNIVDSFRLTRYTALLVIWSIFAGGLADQELSLSPQVLMFLASMVTFVMAVGSKPEPSPKLHDNTANSFHKIYSEDYLSDDETMSMLSQQLNGSCVSMRSVKSNKSSPIKPINSTSPRLAKSPLTSSAFSLNQLPRRQISPNSSFRSYAGEENQTLRPVFATPMPMPQTRQGLFASDLQLNNRPTHHGSTFGLNTSMTSASVFNNSFVEPREQSRLVNQTQDNDASFFTAGNTTAVFNGDNTFAQPSQQRITSGIFSPFSASTSAVYQQSSNPNPPARPNRLLSPTRFSTTNLSHNNSANASWLAGGYFNQRQSMSEIPRNGLLLQSVTNPLTPMEEGLSRASSHSSGFESQHGGAGNPLSRENSLCPDVNDYHQRTLTMDNINGFQPIDSPSLGAFSPRPSVFSNPSLNNINASHMNSDVWRQSAFSRRPINSATSVFSSRTNTDSFNLRKINEELPSIKRGELFQQWKEGQTIS